MQRPVLKWFAAGAGLVLACVAFLVWRSGEPGYQGRRLSEWIDRYASTEFEQDLDREALAAVRAIGTNALPWLLEDLQAREPGWVGRGRGYLPDKWSDFLSGDGGLRRNARADVGFEMLGAQARPAVPALGRLTTSPDPAVAIRACRAVADVGGRASVPFLAGMLSNRHPALVAYGLQGLSDLGPQAAEALPQIQQILDLPPGVGAGVRQTAILAFANVARDRESALPAVLKALDDREDGVRMSAVQALGFLGERGRLAAPKLEELRRTESARSNFVERIDRSLRFIRCEVRDHGIVRGPKEAKSLALIFTGHEFAEGADTILNELSRRGAKASFFLTGDFLRRPEFRSIVQRVVAENHLLGPHSDRHLLYCEWDKAKTRRVTRAELWEDLEENCGAIQPFGRDRDSIRFFVPPFEHYNPQIADWAGGFGFNLVNFTPGTRSTADYTGETDKNFVSSQAILESITRCEAADPRGLNGFLLLLHLGAGPKRTDKFHARFGEVLDFLQAKGYQLARVDELLGL